MEDFDKRIREKLQEVRPPLPTNAWASFRRLLPLPWYAVLWQQYGSWLMGGLLTTGLAGTLFTIYQDKQTIEKLNGEISTLKNTKQILVSASPQIIEKWRVDTVYVNGQWTMDNGQQNQPSVVSSQLATGGVPLSSNQLADSGQPIAHSRQGIEATRQELKNNGQWTMDNGQRNELPGFTNQLSVNSQEPTEKSQEGQRVTSNQLPVISDELVNNQIADSRQPTADSQQILEQFKQQFGEDTTKSKNKAGKKAFKMPKLYPRVGIETAFADFKSSEFSPLFEIFLSDNFSLSSGISAHKTQEERYPKLPDFNKATGKDFTERFKPKLPKHDRIEEIEISTTSIRLPINLKYYVPFKNAFSFLFSTGTTLDLSVYQSVKFESYLQGEETYRSFEDKLQPQIFKNLIFGSGLQYQRGRIIGQFYPFFDYTFRKPDYVPKDGGRVGLKAGIWVDLSKK